MASSDTTPDMPEPGPLGQMQREIERLRLLLDWCRPRLGRPAYRETLDRMRLRQPDPDHTPIVQSANDDR